MLIEIFFQVSSVLIHATVAEAVIVHWGHWIANVMWIRDSAIAPPMSLDAGATDAPPDFGITLQAVANVSNTWHHSALWIANS